jgi:hypothetical protein
MTLLSLSTGGSVWSDFSGTAWAVFPAKPNSKAFGIEMDLQNLKEQMFGELDSWFDLNT